MGNDRLNLICNFNLDVLKEYFSNGIKKSGKQYGGIYYVKMKQMVVEAMDKEKYHYNEISNVIRCERTTVYHYLFDIKSNEHVEKEVKKQFEEWISNRQYPISVIGRYEKPISCKLQSKIE